MEKEQNVGGRDRVVRAVLAVVLSVLALRWLKAGKRGRGLLAGVGALGFGFNATTGYCGLNDTLDVDTTADGLDDATSIDTTDTSDVGTADTGAVETAETDAADASGTAAATDGGLTCAFCGDAIKPGQRRGPNDQGQIVHGDCA